MKQSYKGGYWELIDPSLILKMLLEEDVPVYYRHVWADRVKDKVTYSNWAMAETMVDLASTGEKPKDRSWLMEYDMEVSYDIPDDKYKGLVERYEEFERERDAHWNRVMARPVKTSFYSGLTEYEKGYLYDHEIAPERNFFDNDYFDIHGKVRGIN